MSILQLYSLLQINNSYFSKMDSLGLLYELVSLDVNEASFEEEQGILNTREKSRTSQRY